MRVKYLACLMSSMEFGRVIINITRINDAFNKNFVIPFVCYFLYLRFTASLAPVPSYTINDFYNVLHLSSKFDHEFRTTLYMEMLLLLALKLALKDIHFT